MKTTLSNEGVRRMAREYYAEYQAGADVHDAMKNVLVKNSIPPEDWGGVAEMIRNFASRTVMTVRQMEAKYERDFAKRNLPRRCEVVEIRIDRKKLAAGDRD